MIEKDNAIFMEESEYIEYLKKQQARNKEENISTPVAQVNLYELNKNLIQDLKKMNNMEINAALKKVYQWFVDIQAKPNGVKHFALLNHEYHYFTLFEAKTETSKGLDFIHQLKDILTNWYGDKDIRAIDVVDDYTVEIWAMCDGAPMVAYLFPYDKGVVYY